jgi:hypothetical protein
LLLISAEAQTRLEITGSANNGAAARPCKNSLRFIIAPYLFSISGLASR